MSSGAPSRPTTKIPQKRPFSYRTAYGTLEWRGIMPDGDTASNPDNVLAMVFNGRFRAGSVRNRGGQRKITENEIGKDGATCVYPFDFPLATPRTIFSLADGCPGQSNTVGGSTSFYDYETLPQFQPGIYYNTTTRNIVAAAFAGDLYLGTDLDFRRYTQIAAPRGQSGLEISGSQQDLPLFAFDPTEFSGFLRLAAFDGAMFLGMEVVPAGDSLVLGYDGIGLFDDGQAFPGQIIRDMVQFRNQLAILLDGGGSALALRERGVAPGSYSFFGAAETPFRAISYRDVLYMTSLGEDLYSFDGTTLTTIPIGTTGVAAGAITYGIAVVDGDLYFSWSPSGGLGPANIGKYDGFNDIWTPIEKAITTEFPTARDARPLIAYRGGLALAATDVGNTKIYLSRNKANIPLASGGWSQVNASIAGTGGEIYELVSR